MKGFSHRSEVDEVPGAMVATILKLAGSSGVDLDEFFHAINISRSVLAKNQPLPSTSRIQFSPVYKSCMAMFRERAEVVHGHSNLSFDCADLLCACILNCQKLEDAIHRAIKFVEVMNGRGMQISLETNDKYAELKIHARKGSGSIEEIVCDFFEVFFYYKLFSWLVAEPLADVIELAYRRSPDEKVLEEMMGGVVHLERCENSFFFKKEMLKRPIVRTARELDEVLKVSPIELLPPPPAKRLSVILTGIFRRSLEEKVHIPQVDEVAYQLGQSGPTLRRHLAKENTSFQELVDKCRMEKASELLRDSTLTIDDISYHLGFSAPSGFSRAFKDWVGCAPSIYRQRQNEHEIGGNRIAVGYR